MPGITGVECLSAGANALPGMGLSKALTVIQMIAST